MVVKRGGCEGIVEDGGKRGGCEGIGQEDGGQERSVDVKVL